MVAPLPHAFFRLHCVLCSPAGRKKLARLLDTPQTNQIDAYLSLLHNLGKIDVITSPDFAKQKLHVSTIQETLGSFSPLSMLAHAPYRTIALVVALVVCTCTIRRTSFRAGRACFRYFMMSRDRTKVSGVTSCSRRATMCSTSPTKPIHLMKKTFFFSHGSERPVVADRLGTSSTAVRDGGVGVLPRPSPSSRRSTIQFEGVSLRLGPR